MEWDENTSAMFGVSTEGHRPGIAESKNLKVKTSIDALAIEVEALAVKVTALAARIAERDQQLVRLRRETDVMINGLYEGGGNDLDEVARAAYDAGGERPRDLSPWTFTDESGTDECDDHLRRWKYVLDVEVAR